MFIKSRNTKNQRTKEDPSSKNKHNSKIHCKNYHHKSNIKNNKYAISENKLGAKGRPVGSKNKSADVQKFELQQMLFNIEDMKKEIF